MNALAPELRKQLGKTVVQARDVAESGARKALEALAVHEPDSYPHLSDGDRLLRRALRAQARQLGDEESRTRKSAYDTTHLQEKIAYDQWHRLLFARFLIENNLLMSPEHGVTITLSDCDELAPTLGLSDGWAVAARFAATELPEIFCADDPAGRIALPVEDRKRLMQLVTALPTEVFLADDALGWVYQFWQAKRKYQVNESGTKIGADELAVVTQLFTEDYMVLFLLHNTLGAWWAGKQSMDWARSATEGDCRKAISLSGIEWTYLRFVKIESDEWRPAAGTFDGWPKTTRDLRVLDPCMGSGHFLVAELPILVAMRMVEEGLTKKEAVVAILRDNLYGLELDARCSQIAAFNLALAAWKLAGYQKLPPLNLACSGLAPRTKLETWTKLANGDQRLREGMERLYSLFKDGPTLGSLINPRKFGSDLLTAEFHHLQPLLQTVLEGEDDGSGEAGHELTVTAKGIAHAAELLSEQFTLVATNVPYLTRMKQDKILKDFSDRWYPEAKADLATTFLERCLEFCACNGSAAIVTPQNWLFLGSYKQMRAKLLERDTWNLVAKLGPSAFEDMNWWAANTAMLIMTVTVPQLTDSFAGLDVSTPRKLEEKSNQLKIVAILLVSQLIQLKNPDARIVLRLESDSTLLGEYADSYWGLGTGDYSRYGRLFWELPVLTKDWIFQLSTVHETKPYAGREHILFWQEGKGALVNDPGAFVRGVHIWGKTGVLVSQMNRLPVTLYTGEAWDTNSAPIIPKDPKDLIAIWAFCSSSDYVTEVRKIDQKTNVTNATLVKVPFDLRYWEEVAAAKHPNGLPKPFSNDPTQWLFNGHPRCGNYRLQVAVGRLLDYRWPRQIGSSFPDCHSLEPDGLEKFTDEDGIVCISAIKGEDPAAERLRALLAAAHGSEWDAAKQTELLAEVGYASQTLEDWLRNGFFEQHCALFHHRPFIWQIWDGRRDGFSALVNYHKLDKSALEKLTYTYLGDWIARQQTAVAAGEASSDARLQAAKQLQGELKKIIEGETPYDIFVRWKPIESQPIGWDPDLNDGVRLNIRPFMTAKDVGKKGAGILRAKPSINWNKDRGTDVASAPWFKVFNGERINDHHLTLDEKRKAREAKAR